MAKAAIAAALIQYEKDEAIRKPHLPKKHWYRFLFQRMMGDHRDDFIGSAHRLSIITFNYDRSLEYYFWKALNDSFEEKRAIEFYKYLKITHVYGSLGKPHFINPADPSSRPFDPAVTEVALKKCVDSMQMVTEAGMPNDIGYVAGDLFMDVKVVCFLGFGYAPQNIRRLIYRQEFLAGKEIYGTAYHLSATRKREVTQEISGVILGDRDDDVLTFLEKYIIL